MLSRMLNDPFHEISMVNVHFHPAYCILMQQIKSHLSKRSEDREIGRLALETKCSLSHFASEHQTLISFLLKEPAKGQALKHTGVTLLENKQKWGKREPWAVCFKLTIPPSLPPSFHSLSLHLFLSLKDISVIEAQWWQGPGPRLPPLWLFTVKSLRKWASAWKRRWWSGALC